MLIDYHVHALAHGEYEYSSHGSRNIFAGLEAQNIAQIGFSEHDWFEERIDIELVKGVAARSEFCRMMVRVGIEVDYKPGREPEISRILAQKPYDFVIGSVHHLGEWPFDHPDHKNGFLQREIDEIYQEYYAMIDRAVKSNLFDVVGHLDLIKVWGFKPTARQENHFIKPLLRGMRMSGTVVEINTGGLRKPVKEMYPANYCCEIYLPIISPLPLARMLITLRSWEAGFLQPCRPLGRLATGRHRDLPGDKALLIHYLK